MLQRSNRCEVLMFSLIALYLAYRRGALAPAIAVASLAPVAINDRDAVPIARAA